MTSRVSTKDCLAVLNESRAVTNGHYVYASGLHGPVYINKALIRLNTSHVELITTPIADHFCAHNVEVVVSPAVGAISFGDAVADHLSLMEDAEVLSVIAEKYGEGFVLRRGYGDIVRDKRTLVVEDILTTGGSVRKVLAALEACGANVIGIGAVLNRGGVRFDGLPLFSSVDQEYNSYEAESCPLCQQGVPINTELGHGADFVRKHGQPAK